mgnify:CR=1 FL=1
MFIARKINIKNLNLVGFVFLDKKLIRIKKHILKIIVCVYININILLFQCFLEFFERLC